MMKGNDGKAARSRLLKRIVEVFTFFGGLFMGMYLLGIGPFSPDQRNKETPLSSSSSSLNQNVRGNDRHSTLSAKAYKDGRIGNGRENIMSVFLQDNSLEAGDTSVEADLQDSRQVKIFISGALNLVDLHSDPESLRGADDDTYQGVMGSFCPVNFDLHKESPSSYPMFRFLVSKSAGCETPVRADLGEVVKLARRHDEDIQRAGLVAPKTLVLSGVVFHESRCGSTLVANALAGMNPQQHRVYSESSPFLAAIRSTCGEDLTHCTMQQAVALVKDVVYLMSRTDDPRETRVFFKVQSIGSRSIKVFQQAFPSIPWIYVYRKPVQVLMSQLKYGAKRANCVHAAQSGSNRVLKLANKRTGLKHSLNAEEYCAAHLATLTESAVEALERDEKGMGAAVNYESLPDILYEDIVPNHFKVPVSLVEKEKMVKVSSLYSKGTGGREGEFEVDSEQKEREATSAIRHAAKIFLQESFEQLEEKRRG